MKISELQKYLTATLKHYGDLECLLDIDADDEDLYEIQGVFCDMDPQGEPPLLVLATFNVQHKLQVVK